LLLFCVLLLLIVVVVVVVVVDFYCCCCCCLRVLPYCLFVTLLLFDLFRCCVTLRCVTLRFTLRLLLRLRFVFTLPLLRYCFTFVVIVVDCCVTLYFYHLRLNCWCFVTLLR